MRRPIGYYVHHHGDGHRQRALAIAEALGGRVTLLGTGLAGRTGHIRAVDLPDDRIAGDSFAGNDAGPRPNALHYAPIDHDGIRRRVSVLTAWIADMQPALIVVDVSVEVAMLARLASVPTVYVRLNGRRDDIAHLEAFRGAKALLAPFAAGLDDLDTPENIRRHTFYAPGLGVRRGSAEVDPKKILVVVGRGGERVQGDAWAAAAAAMPDYRWQVIGPCTHPANCPANLMLLGWVDDAATMIASAGIVIGAAGDGLVGSVIASRRPFICLPERRPYGEQMAKAARLEALRAAIVSDRWPKDRDWPELIARARALDPQRQAALDAEDGAQRVARWLADLADVAVSSALEIA